MRRIDSYLFYETLKYFLMVLLLISTIFVVVDYLSNADKFFAARLSTQRAFFYVFLRLLKEIRQLVPIAFLISVLLSFGLMNRSNEFIALKGGGISPFALLKSLFFFAALLSLSLFLYIEYLSPLVSNKLNDIFYGEIRNLAVKTAKREDIRIREGRFFIHIDQLDFKAETLHGIDIIELSEEGFLPVRRIRGKSAGFVSEGWLLKEAFLQDIDESELVLSHLTYPSYLFKNSISFEDFSRSEKSSDEMSIRDLWKYSRKIAEEGYDNTIFRADLFDKTAFIFSAFFISFSALAIALGQLMRKNMVLGMALGMGFAFLYWVFHSFTLSMAYGGMLPAAFAAWMPNLFFGSIGAYFVLMLD